MTRRPWQPSGTEETSPSGVPLRLPHFNPLQPPLVRLALLHSTRRVAPTISPTSPRFVAPQRQPIRVHLRSLHPSSMGGEAATGGRHGESEAQLQRESKGQPPRQLLRGSAAVTSTTACCCDVCKDPLLRRPLRAATVCRRF